MGVELGKKLPKKLIYTGLTALTAFTVLPARASAEEVDRASQCARLPETELSTGQGLQVESTLCSYRIDGSTLSELASQMYTKGPEDKSGHWAAATHWTLSWLFNPNMRGLGCRIEDVTVKVQVKIIAPMPTTLTSLSLADQERWQDYYNAVIFHEYGHVNRAVQAGQGMLDTLSNYPIQPNCIIANDEGKKVGDQIVAENGVNQTNYDNETGHGLTQRAYLATN